jgi:hypothetical protein
MKRHAISLPQLIKLFDIYTIERAMIPPICFLLKQATLAQLPLGRAL